MSDFINSGWAWYVAGLTVASLAFCVFILVVASRRKVMAADNTTGHTWDEDLREMNNPLPRWWMWLFVITVVFAAAYLTFYPGLGSNPGTFKWSSAGQWENEQQKAHAAMAPVYDKFKAMPAAELAKDAQAMGIGERLFVNNCAQCHGSDARGSKGFPNLTDGDWLGGTGPDYIKKTITGGRMGMMPAQGPVIGEDGVRNVAAYVLTELAGRELPEGTEADIAAGKQIFSTLCAACHTPAGTGMPMMGAPDLTQPSAFIYGSSFAQLQQTIRYGRSGNMPAQGDFLGNDKAHLLAAYVLKLSQGEDK